MSDHRGNLSVVEQLREVPFEIKRLFWIYGVPEGQGRAAHAHKEQAQFVLPMSGSFDIVLDNGEDAKETYHMNQPDRGLLIEPGTWISLENFSKNAVCLVIAPEPYDESDYMREYDEFLDWIRCHKLRNKP